MTASTVVPVLFVVTITAVALFAYISKRKTEERMKRDDVPRSALAKDGPDTR